MSMKDFVVAQFRKPRGLPGQLAGWIMAHRPSNRMRNLWTVDLLDLEAGDGVLEIGCGPGLALAACLERVNGDRVIGLDHSEAMLAQARKRNAGAIEAGRLDLRLGDVSDVTALGGDFDKIFSVNVAQFFPGRAAAFRIIHGALRPGGLSATTYMPRCGEISRESAARVADEVTRHMENAGFEDIRVEELPLKPAPALSVLGLRP